MTRAMVSAVAVVGLVATLPCCTTGRPGPGAGDVPTWPPRGLDSPGEVVWLGEVSEFQASGVTGFLRAVAGARGGREGWQLARPTSVAVLPGAVVSVDTASGQVTLSGRDGSGARKLPLPEGFVPVVVAASRARAEILVADGSTGEILSFTTKGRLARTALQRGLLSRCGGIAPATDGGFLATDVETGAVLRVSAGGKVVARVGRRGGRPGEFNFPTAILEAPDGTVWVLDTLNFRVQHLDPDLNPLGAFGQLGDGSGHFALPKGLAMDGGGHLYVSDARFDNIQVFDQEGRLLFAVGSRGRGPGEFWSPAGLAFGPDDVLAVADSGNRRVQLLQYRRREGATRR